jgi:poly-gamma-glutamate synthesis protein (capsule biosynthesis protein)
MKTTRLILFLLLALSMIPAQQHTARAQIDDCSAGSVRQETYTSAILRQEMIYSIFLPACYGEDPDQRYPTVYLLHGSDATDEHWLRLGLAEQLDRLVHDGNLPPMIIVMPYGSGIANINQVGDVSWETVFLNELIPTIEDRYQIDRRPSARAIGGISRGGFWAFAIALRHPWLFGAVGGHSAFFDLYNVPPAYNPLDLALKGYPVGNLRIWLDRGRDDRARQNIDLMHDRLTERGITHEYIVYPQGRHEDAYWSQHIVDYLRFYGAMWLDAADPIPAEQTTSGSGQYVILPTVDFFSTQTTITAARLESVLNGEFDFFLVLDQSTRDLLERYGVYIHRRTYTVAPDELPAVLHTNPLAYTLLPFELLNPQFRVLNIGGQHPLDLLADGYPFVFASDASNFVPAKLTRILLSGTTALARHTGEALDANGITWAGEAIQPYVLRPDFFHISNEVSFHPMCPASDEPVLGGLCAKDSYLELLQYLDVDIIELTGNHNADYGYEAYTRTLEIYQENQIPTVGGGLTLDDARRPLLIEHNGSRIGWVACNWNGPDHAWVNEYHPGAAYCDHDWLAETLPKLSQENDLLIVTVQYAEYDQHQPIDRQKNYFRELADLGADVVIGTQAHVPQTFEFTEQGAFIHYGLGNLFFDQIEEPNTQFFMDQLFIYDGQLVAVDLFTGQIEDRARPRPMTPDEQAEFLYDNLSSG